MATPKVSAKIIKSVKPIQKADVSTQVVTESNSGADFITPLYDLPGFKALVNNSSILPQCIRAYKNNIAGFGIGIKYKEDFDKETEEMKVEWNKLDNILRYFNLDCDTKEVFEDLIEARETYGIAYLEVIRNNAGEVVGGEFINNTPSVRKTVPLDPYVEVEYEADGKMQKRRKRFRKYKQELNGKTVYFKEMGDPRIMDLRDGVYYEKGKGVSVPIEYQANEIQEFVIGTEPYGETRWLGTTLNVDGSRKAENLNNRYFVEGRHTPLMILIRGGTLTEDSFAKLQTYMDDIKGENGQHAFVVLETENLDNRTDMEGEQKPDLEIVKMADVLQNDELFQNYLDNNRHKVQSSFLLPDLYVGYTSDFNRATAQTAQEITEKQVFQPERQSLAWIINNKLFVDYHFKYVEVYFLEPDMSNPDDLAKLLSICNMAGGLTPNKAKDILYASLGETSENFDGDWADLPMAYLQLQAAGAGQGQQGPSEEAPEKTDAKLDEQISQQIEKSVEHNDAEITAVLKEIRKLLIESQENEEKAFTFIGKSDIIKEWDEDAHPRDEKGRFSSTGGSSSGTGETEPCKGFANEKFFNRHFNKHADEFGDITKEEYLQKGIDFLKQSCEGDVVGYSFYDETIGAEKVVRFNTKTTEYATGTPGKSIYTYFKAKYDKKRACEKVETANAYYRNHRRLDLNE